ncbi:hypothetical protein B0H16DRAFT_392551 [Mycena metata]|uniref:Secreted protein n=1 Tax=Mycena metata TaxID=1033252 RepID=A0AAD7MJ75_9AGAR|nr:hypothetical protein B0H16DRAFT_392551 [Mycena metata]
MRRMHTKVRCMLMSSLIMSSSFDSLYCDRRAALSFVLDYFSRRLDLSLSAVALNLYHNTRPQREQSFALYVTRYQDRSCCLDAMSRQISPGAIFCSVGSRNSSFSGDL